MSAYKQFEYIYALNVDFDLITPYIGFSTSTCFQKFWFLTQKLSLSMNIYIYMYVPSQVVYDVMKKKL